jgi:hypothetical protein
MRVSRLALAMSVALVPLGFYASPASASSYPPPRPRFGGTWNVTVSITGSKLYAQIGAAGEIDDAYICDTLGDGHHAHVDIYAIGNRGDTATTRLRSRTPQAGRSRAWSSPT